MAKCCYELGSAWGVPDTYVIGLVLADGDGLDGLPQPFPASAEGDNLSGCLDQALDLKTKKYPLFSPLEPKFKHSNQSSFVQY